MIIILIYLFGHNGLPRKKSWTLVGGILQHFKASQYVELFFILELELELELNLHCNYTKNIF